MGVYLDQETLNYHFPMLIFDRITEINDNNGTFKKGSLKAELDIKKTYGFDCHSKELIMPDCLGLDVATSGIFWSG